MPNPANNGKRWNPVKQSYMDRLEDLRRLNKHYYKLLSAKTKLDTGAPRSFCNDVKRVHRNHRREGFTSIDENASALPSQPLKRSSVIFRRHPKKQTPSPDLLDKRSHSFYQPHKPHMPRLCLHSVQGSKVAQMRRMYNPPLRGFKIEQAKRGLFDRQQEENLEIDQQKAADEVNAENIDTEMDAMKNMTDENEISSTTVCQRRPIRIREQSESRDQKILSNEELLRILEWKFVREITECLKIAQVFTNSGVARLLGNLVNQWKARLPQETLHNLVAQILDDLEIEKTECLAIYKNPKDYVGEYHATMNLHKGSAKIHTSDSDQNETTVGEKYRHSSGESNENFVDEGTRRIDANSSTSGDEKISEKIGSVKHSEVSNLEEETDEEIEEVQEEADEVISPDPAENSHVPENFSKHNYENAVYKFENKKTNRSLSLESNGKSNFENFGKLSENNPADNQGAESKSPQTPPNQSSAEFDDESGKILQETVNSKVDMNISGVTEIGKTSSTLKLKIKNYAEKQPEDSNRIEKDVFRALQQVLDDLTLND